jgi:hypothetical protein
VIVLFVSSLLLLLLRVYACDDSIGIWMDIHAHLPRGENFNLISNNMNDFARIQRGEQRRKEKSPKIIISLLSYSEYIVNIMTGFEIIAI